MIVKQTAKAASAFETRFVKNFAEAKVTKQAPLISVSGYDTWFDTKTGEDNPNWRQQIARGLNATTEYTVVGEERRAGYGQGGITYFDILNRTYVRRFEGHPQHVSWSTFPDPSVLSETLADQLARLRFISAYRKRRTAFQSGVFLGELMQTVKMISSPAKTLRRSLNWYYHETKERLKKSQARNRKRVIQDSWLEYTMGVAPLISDVKSAISLAEACPLAYSQEIRAPILTPKTNVQFPDSHFFVGFRDITYGEVAVTYQGAIRAEAMGIPPGFAEQFGLSWSNVLPTAWELIPYSFLVDYFTNIGKVIEAMSTGPIHLAWGCRHLLKQYRRELVSLGFSHKAAQAAQWPNGAVRYEGYGDVAGKIQSRTYYKRTRIDKVSVGIRDLRFKLPNSGIQWLNIPALIRLRQ